MPPTATHSLLQETNREPPFPDTERKYWGKKDEQVSRSTNKNMLFYIYVFVLMPVSGLVFDSCQTPHVLCFPNHYFYKAFFFFFFYTNLFFWLDFIWNCFFCKNFYSHFVFLVNWQAGGSTAKTNAFHQLLIINIYTLQIKINLFRSNQSLLLKVKKSNLKRTTFPPLVWLTGWLLKDVLRSFYS